MPVTNQSFYQAAVLMFLLALPSCLFGRTPADTAVITEDTGHGGYGHEGGHGAHRCGRSVGYEAITDAVVFTVMGAYMEEMDTEVIAVMADTADMASMGTADGRSGEAAEVSWVSGILASDTMKKARARKEQARAAETAETSRETSKSEVCSPSSSSKTAAEGGFLLTALVTIPFRRTRSSSPGCVNLL
ncbi:hypothetical protein HPB47_017236 [Ixodes persulcatus]|uniref:Uncharacterized protein n=1 Tax=Ixodes persulcatus TaxID=34615 RepID=A0AC60QQT7_IXOPE|nr:hypothetical protein HPB47_017236 [Ixodes persulcatus]